MVRPVRAQTELANVTTQLQLLPVQAALQLTEEIAGSAPASPSVYSKPKNPAVGSVVKLAFVTSGGTGVKIVTVTFVPLQETEVGLVGLHVPVSSTLSAHRAK